MADHPRERGERRQCQEPGCRQLIYSATGLCHAHRRKHVIAPAVTVQRDEINVCGRWLSVDQARILALSLCDAIELIQSPPKESAHP